MASDLLTQYTEAANSEFRNRLVQALAKKAATELNATGTGDPEYPRYVSLARKALNQGEAGVTFVARALVANGYNNDSLDLDIQAAIDTYFDTFAKMFDPVVE